MNVMLKLDGSFMPVAVPLYTVATVVIQDGNNATIIMARRTTDDRDVVDAINKARKELGQYGVQLRSVYAQPEMQPMTGACPPDQRYAQYNVSKVGNEWQFTDRKVGERVCAASSSIHATSNVTADDQIITPLAELLAQFKS